MKPAASLPVLEVQNLCVAFGDLTVLNDVSFKLRRDEVLGIVGETGSGKSILARAIINLLPAGGKVVSGDVKLDGKSVFSANEEEIRQIRGGRISLIGTNAKSLLDPVRTVGSQVVKALRAHRRIGRKEAIAEAIRLFDQVGIVQPERRVHAYPHELSGGMAQRVVIAMALISKPDVVLADDATLGLDATIQVQVLDLLVSRSRELGLGAVVVTHDLGIVAQYCDRVAIMKGGRVVELKPVGEFLTNPEVAYSRELLEAAKARPTPMPAAGKIDDSTTPLAEELLLRVEHLVKYFTSDDGRVIRAVDDISFAVARNRTLALVGESGSGKTTVGQCLAKLLNADSGRIDFEGTEIAGMPEKQFRPMRRRIQMVFQEPYVALNPRWTVEDLIAEPLALQADLSRHDRAARVRALLDLVQMPARLAAVYPHELTAGEQKRVGIARALATSPEFVVFDEPTTGLHFADVRVLVKVFQRLVDRGHSVIVVEHNLDLIKAADWIIDLGPEAGDEGGQVTAEGTPEEVAACDASHTGLSLRAGGVQHGHLRVKSATK